MTNIEKKFIDLATVYLKKALMTESYSSERETFINVAEDILLTLCEGEEDGRAENVCEDYRGE